MPERLQCPVFAPRSSIQCVMEEGHDVPLVEWPGGEPIDHNFGGIGPYTPMIKRQEPTLAMVADSVGWCLPRNVIVPPRCGSEIHRERHLLVKEDRARREELATGVEGLLPAYRAQHANAFAWTTPAGLWRLEFQYADPYRPFWNLIGPNGTWQIEDPALDHVRSVLIVSGAVGVA